MTLADLVVAQGGLLAASVRASDGAGEPEPDLAVAAVREGHDCHYAGAGAVVAPADPDLALLAGDALYALGLEQLAARGDLAAIRLLADVISDCAAAHADDRPQAARARWREALRQLDESGRPSGRPEPSS